MKSVIKAIIPGQDKEWNGKILRKRQISFENGESGELTLFPEMEEVKPGQELEFEIQDRGYGKEIKISRPGGGGGRPGGARKTPEQEANINAIAVLKSALEGGQVKTEDWKAFYLEAFNFFSNFNLGKPKNEVTKTEPAPAAPAPEAAPQADKMPWE
jgi:hypothetical protein